LKPKKKKPPVQKIPKKRIPKEPVQKDVYFEELFACDNDEDNMRFDGGGENIL
jgi:hypothetical protein